MSTCDFCGSPGPTAQVEFRQNTGMILARQSRTWAGSSCKDCGNAIFKKATLHTLFLGWWGVISVILTPVFILSNLANVMKTRGLKALPAASSVEDDAR